MDEGSDPGIAQKPVTYKVVICFVLDSHWSANLGGAELQVKYLIQELRDKRDITVYYVCRRSAVSVDDGVEVIRLKAGGPLARYFHFVDYFSLMKTLKALRPDYIYTRVDLSYVGIAARFCKQSNCKLIWHIAHERDVSKYVLSDRRSYVKFLDRKIFEYGVRNADIIVGQAAYQNSLLKTNFGRSCDLIVRNFHPMPDEPIIKETATTVVWIANIKKVKQPELFLRLAADLKKDGRIHFVMIGAIHEKHYEGVLNQHLSLTSNLTYRGCLSLDETNLILAKSHIFVNTSISEGFPNTFIQAWMRKVAVVSLCVDPDGVISRNSLGYVSRTYEQLTRDVSRLVEDDHLRNQIGERSRLYAAEHFGMRNARELIDLFV